MAVNMVPMSTDVAGGGRDPLVEALGRQRQQASPFQRMQQVAQGQQIGSRGHGTMALATALIGGLGEGFEAGQQRRQQVQGANAVADILEGSGALPSGVNRGAILAAVLSGNEALTRSLIDRAMRPDDIREVGGNLVNVTQLQRGQRPAPQAGPQMPVNGSMQTGGMGQPPAMGGGAQRQPGVIFSAGPEWETLSTPEQRRAAGIRDNDTRPFQLNRRSGQLQALNESTQVTNNLSTERTGREELIKRGLDGMDRANASAQQAQRRIAAYGQMLTAMEGFKPGATAETRLTAQRYLKDLGLISGEGVSDGEAFRAVQRRLELAATPQGQGQITENERVLIREQIPSLTTSPEGVQQIIGMLRQLDEYDMRVAQIYREEARANPQNVPDHLRVQERIAELGSPLTEAQQNALMRNRELTQGGGQQQQQAQGGAIPQPMPRPDDAPAANPGGVPEVGSTMPWRDGSTWRYLGGSPGIPENWEPVR